MASNKPKAQDQAQKDEAPKGAVATVVDTIKHAFEGGETASQEEAEKMIASGEATIPSDAIVIPPVPSEAPKQDPVIPEPCPGLYVSKPTMKI